MYVLCQGVVIHVCLIEVRAFVIKVMVVILFVFVLASCLLVEMMHWRSVGLGVRYMCSHNRNMLAIMAELSSGFVLHAQRHCRSVTSRCDIFMCRLFGSSFTSSLKDKAWLAIT